jgi:hypothetical protein
MRHVTKVTALLAIYCFRYPCTVATGGCVFRFEAAEPKIVGGFTLATF